MFRAPRVTTVETPATALVALNRPAFDTLSYSVPEELAASVGVGSFVSVTIGTASEIGVVVGFAPPPPGVARLKSIEAIATPSFRVPAESIELARWIADYYLCGWGEALTAASFLGLRDVRLPRSDRWRLNPEWQAIAGLTKKLAALAERLAQLRPEAALGTRGEIASTLGASPSQMQALAKAGVIIRDDAPVAPRRGAAAEPPIPTAEQAHAIGLIEEAMAAARFQAFLLHGITGSGKTEVYLRAIGTALDAGKSALCLVPEISLTPQTVSRFEERFGLPVGVCHSQITPGEKAVLASHLATGAIRLVIGARSAVFAPLPNLGLIIVDEEHEGSYKQNDTPRYHARDVALVRGRALGIPVVLGSATPSMESFENARRGKYTLLELTVRPTGAELPAVRVVDLAKSARAGATSLISEELQNAIRIRLERGEQSLLLLNRRGFSNFLFCPSCRWVAKCQDDDIALTIHRKTTPSGEEEEALDLFNPGPVVDQGYLRCHFCSARSPIPERCPECEGTMLMAVGSGTQRVDEELRQLFPDANIMRLDADTISGRKAFLEAWNRIVAGEPNILLGTQMLSKGLHLERVTLVGVVLADIGLFIPDFRAEERTFALLSQVAGRAGRRHPGEVLFQTFLPRHDVIGLAMQHDYAGFFERERRRREELQFPPVGRLVALTLSDPDDARARQLAATLGAVLRRVVLSGRFAGAAVKGPLPAPVRRLAGRFRQRLLLRGPRITELQALMREALTDSAWKPPQSARLTIDVDPQELL